jgi:hypothetical protein
MVVTQEIDMGFSSRSSHRTPTYALETASSEHLNSGSSYRVEWDGETFSISAKRSGRQVYYYATKRVHSRLFKTYVGKCGEITPASVRLALHTLLNEIVDDAPPRREKGAGSMRRRERVVFDLLQAYEVVLEAPLAEQQELYQLWRENTTQTLELILSPDKCEAWKSFSAREVDWSSKAKSTLQLKAMQAFLRALTAADESRGQRKKGPSWWGSDPLERFTRRARQALSRARDRAKHLHHDQIHPAHLLIGLAEARNSVSGKILADLGVTADRVQKLLEEMTESVPDLESRASTQGEALEPALKSIIKTAVDEARSLGHHYVDSAHLLLGLIQQNDETVSAILQELGTSLQAVRDATLDKITHASDPSS